MVVIPPDEAEPDRLDATMQHFLFDVFLKEKKDEFAGEVTVLAVAGPSTMSSPREGMMFVPGECDVVYAKGNWNGDTWSFESYLPRGRPVGVILDKALKVAAVRGAIAAYLADNLEPPTTLEDLVRRRYMARIPTLSAIFRPDVLLTGNWAEDARRMLPSNEDLFELDSRPIEVRVDLDSRILEVWLGSSKVRAYRVAVGGPSTPTPEGLYTVRKAVKDPSPPVYGPYGLELLPEIAIHGDGQGKGAGEGSTLGCIRLANEDLAELVEVVPKGTPVRVSRNNVSGSSQNGSQSGSSSPGETGERRDRDRSRDGSGPKPEPPKEEFRWR
ncbi:MAG: L,D-transpeptidase [Anaerolineae bacterium]